MSYNANSIEIKSFREACRSTPGMYIGADGTDGTFNCFLEILNNACDEAIMKRGDQISVILSSDSNSCQIKDEGAGVPHGANERSKEVLIDIYTAAHSSGKFNNKNYQKARGLHGVGSSAVCVCSTNFDVVTKRDGYYWYLKFKDGIPQSEIAARGTATEETGTIINFTPDKTIFHIKEDEPSFSYERIKNELQLTSYFIPNVTFSISQNGVTEKFISKNGLKDFAIDNIEKPLHKNFIYGYKHFEDDVEVEVFAQWTGGHEKSYIFSNGALNIDGGTPETGAKTAFTRTINSLSKGDFNADMIRKGLVYVVNIRHPHPIYQNQSKTKIQNAELRGYTQTVFSEAIKDFVTRNKSDFEKIVELLTKEKKAEAAAEKARQNVLNAAKDVEKNQKKKVFASDKLKDAEFLGQDSMLLLVEGLSAASSVAMARDINKYGILALRGKPLNLFTADEEKTYQNEEIKLLLSAMNIVPGKYDSSKLRYGKIGILSDADADGAAIGLLIMCALYTIAPKFIEEGRLYWMRTPLYLVQNGKKTSYYYTDEEFNKVRNTIKGDVIRAKGLGALSPDQAQESMFTSEFQRLDQLIPDEETLPLLHSLMDKDSGPKKDFIFENIDFSIIQE